MCMDFSSSRKRMQDVLTEGVFHVYPCRYLLAIYIMCGARLSLPIAIY